MLPRTPHDPPLPQGVQLQIADSTDCDRIADFIDGLYLRGRFHRFFAGMSHPPSRQLRMLCGEGGADVIVATAAGAVIGHVMAVDVTGPNGRRSADIGIAVADPWHRHGVATALALTAAARAAARGVPALTMDILADNQPAILLLRRLRPAARPVRAGAAIHVEIPLGDAARTHAGRYAPPERPGEPPTRPAAVGDPVIPRT